MARARRRVGPAPGSAVPTKLRGGSGYPGAGGGPVMRMRSAEWGTIESAECGMRNAELKGEVVPHDARPYIPHSAFHNSALEGGARVEGLILAIDTATDIASA